MGGRSDAQAAAPERSALWALLCLVWMAGLSPATVWAQAGVPAVLPRVEIWGALALAPPSTGGTLDASFSPPLLLGGSAVESWSRQILKVDQGTATGVDAGIDVFFSRRAGIQAAITLSRATLSGVNEDYRVFLRYESRQPPDYIPREFTVDRASPWGATEGTLRCRSIAIGGVVRWRAARGRLGGTVAGGVNIDRYSGEILSLAYTQFVLGGHATLFSTRHRAVMEPAAASFYGPYVGGDVQVHLGGPVAVFAGARVVLRSTTVVPTVFARLVDPNEDTWTPAEADVAGRLDGQPLTLAGTRWRIVAGLRIGLGR